MDLREPSGQLVLGLAALIARPWARMGRAAALDEALVARLQSAPLGRTALDAATRAALDLSALDPSEGFLKALATDPRAQLAARLVLAPEAAQMRVLARLAAAIEQERIRGAVLRRDRMRLAVCLGEDAMTWGMRRAPLVAEPLAALAAPDLDLPEPPEPPATVPPGANPLLGAGRALLLHLLTEAEPGLAALADHVLPGPTADIQRPDAAEADAAWRVVERGLAQ